MRCQGIGKNFKPLVDHKMSKTLEKLMEPNQEIQLDFMGPNIDNKGREKDTYIQKKIHT